MRSIWNDDFLDAAPWRKFASGGADIRVTSVLHEGRRALRLDLDFRGEKGFIGIRKEVDLKVFPESSFVFQIAGTVPKNTLEFKISDRENRNVWRWQQTEFSFQQESESLQIRSSEIPYAWGPDSGLRLRHAGGVEFVIAAGLGGKGSIWINDLQLIDRTSPRPPVVTVSSQVDDIDLPGLLSSRFNGHWTSAADDTVPWLQIDFHQPREYGGLVLHWHVETPPRTFSIQASDSGRKWKRIYQSTPSRGGRSFIPLPKGESRFLQLRFDSPVSLQCIEVQPYDFARTTAELFETMAAASPQGAFPRYMLREQSYWTCAGVPRGKTCSLINEDGLVEPDRGSFSLEPMIQSNGQLLTWADVKKSISLEEGDLPIPSVLWKTAEIELQTTLFGTGSMKRSASLVRYRLTNLGKAIWKGSLLVAIRPHQVSPPWQSWGKIGGVSPIRELSFDGEMVRVNRKKVIIPFPCPEEFQAITFDEGILHELLLKDDIPVQKSVTDPHQMANGILRFPLALHPEETKDVALVVPYGHHREDSSFLMELKQLNLDDAFAHAVDEMKTHVERVEFDLPAGLPSEAAATFRTATGQILINRDGPALQPGPRRYTRCWIRDSALMGAGLNRAGETQALAENVKWYARYQRSDGFVPCCVDENGADPLVEHDSHGQFIYAVVESFRFTGDVRFLRSLWPHVQLAARYLESLRKERLGRKYRSGEYQNRFGLLPESASHEGYLAQPVHSYWDDFWGLRGLYDAAFAAEVLKDSEESRRLQKVADEFKDSIRNSIELVIQQRQLNFIPGSVEWGDYDPTATANALMLLAETAGLPEKPLQSMFDLFFKDTLRRHRKEFEWMNYTAYEIRIIGALVRLGKRDEALGLLRFYLSDRRPKKWNQWPEISWHDRRTPGHLGDLPHTWIAAEYLLAFSSLFAYERQSDDALVIAAGIDPEWLSQPQGIAVHRLPTWFGQLNLVLRQPTKTKLILQIDGTMQIPPGGFVLQPPLSGQISQVTVNGKPHDEWTPSKVVIRKFPSETEIFTDIP